MTVGLEEISGGLGSQRTVGDQVDHLVGGGDGMALDGDGPGLLRSMTLLKAQYEGPHGQRAGLLGSVLDGVTNGDGIRLEGHSGLAGHAHAPHVIGPYGRVLHRQAGQVQIAFLRFRLIGKILGGKISRLLSAGQRFLQPGHEGHAVIGGGAGTDEEALIGAGHGKRRRQGRIAAQAVGQQIAVLLGTGQIRHILPGIHKSHMESLLFQPIIPRFPVRDNHTPHAESFFARF